MISKVMNNYVEAIFDTDRDRAMQVISKAFSDGVAAEDIVFKVVIPSIEQFMTALSVNQVSLAQHFLASQIAADVVEEMVPRFLKKPESLGTIVIGTAPGDFHGLGKRIVIGCLKAKMIQVIDLGLNVSAEKFVDAAVENGAQVIGISSMMVHTARSVDGALKVRQILQEQGLENRIKIIVGGAPYRFDSQMYRQVGADAWAENGLVAAEVIAGLIRETTP